MAAWLLGAEKAFDMRESLFSNNFNFIPTLYVGQSALYLSIWGCKDPSVISSYFPLDQCER